jgi:transposase
MLVAEETVEIRVLNRQGKGIREIARMLGMRATRYGKALSAQAAALRAWARPSKALFALLFRHGLALRWYALSRLAARRRDRDGVF